MHKNDRVFGVASGLCLFAVSLNFQNCIATARPSANAGHAGQAMTELVFGLKGNHDFITLFLFSACFQDNVDPVGQIRLDSSTDADHAVVLGPVCWLVQAQLL